MKKARSRKTNRVGLLVLIASLAGLAVLVLGAMIYGIYLVRRDQFGAPGDKSFAPDQGAVGKLQESEYAFARSRLKMKLPRGFKEDTNRSSDSLEEIEFRDGPLRNPKDGTQPEIWAQVVPVPEASWGNVSRDLNVYLDKAVIPALQRKGARVTRRGEAETGTINGVKFIRLEVDGGWVGRTDRYVLYFGTSRPFLITFHCHCPLDRVNDWLPILEASVRTLRR